jgi:uncharacterized protein (TIGR03435 family)
MLRIFVGVLFVLLPGAVSGQTTPHFDLADVHAVARTNQGTRPAILRGGRYEIHNASMVELIRTAYGVDADKVLGGPNWLEWDWFDVTAKAPPNTSPEALKQMLQDLLAERFKLVVHPDSKPLQTYALTAGKTPKLKEASGGDAGCKSSIQGFPTAAQQAGGTPQPILVNQLTFVYTCRSESMAAFTEQMRTMLVAQSYLGTNPIVDQTGLKGVWDFDFKYTQQPRAGAAGAAEVITLFDAMEKQLGLKLEPVKVPMTVMVVDSVKEQPSANPPGTIEGLPRLATEFEVADIRPTEPGATGGQGNAQNGRVSLRNIPLRTLLNLSFDINSEDGLAGIPKFAETAHFDLLAKLPSNGGPPDRGLSTDTLRAPMRALLEDRFKLKTHEESRPATGYTLKSVKPKMAKADPATRTGCKEGPGADGKDPRTSNPALSRLVTCHNITMAQFAQQLQMTGSGYIRTPVIDATDLDGAYDFTLSFSPPALINGNARIADGVMVSANNANGSADPTGGLSLFDAVSKQLGLKLEPDKRSVQVIVIDHLEEKPTDN